jgi:hypothetical protein
MARASTDALAARLAVLEDRQAIMDLYARYLWLIDTRDWERMKSDRIFTDDAELSFGHGHGPSATGFTARGPAEILEFYIRHFSELVSGTAHYFTNVAIEMSSDDIATVRSYLLSFNWNAQAPHNADPYRRPADYVGVGVRLDEVRKVGDQWRIAKTRRRSLGPSPFGLGGPSQADLDKFFGTTAQGQ